VREAFQFMSEHHHQGLILHLNDNPMDSVDIRHIERVLGDVCVEFANKTLGVKHFQTGEVRPNTFAFRVLFLLCF
jgi:hypothetical protein